ncbi:hypothetical protein EJ04DRAFT_574348 [Polyplosphaeria fusca]|uniref:DUF7703 domain-containing protein n=1 Tax=Polyplosphaeria fusca TaxID=682080 RepID=A0A9P4R6S7_9PLEO|nr:hypothetical protein EJ04DRAFT_574348 [Polyplosphaeria fusca]
MAVDNGIGIGYSVPYHLALTMIAFLAVAVYNVIELTLVIFTTFKRRGGLYFYSLLVSSWGIVPYSLGFFFKFYRIPVPVPLYVTLVVVGWPCMVTGQSLVLYSRLHLIARNTLAGGRWVLIMIIVNAIICHVPVTVFLYGANSSNSEPFIRPYSISEKIQVTIFFIQECIISGIYVFKTAKLLRSEGNIRGRNARKVMTHLIWVNIMVIILDITLLSIEYAGYYDIQTTYKAAVYSCKLKMEFAILNKLLDLFQGRIQDSSDDPRSRSAGRNNNTMLGTLRSKGRSQAPPNATHNSTMVGAGLGNSAYARMEDTLGGVNIRDMEVVKTTEVTVERSDPATDEGKSEMDVESTGDVKSSPFERRMSASSSEVQIVRGGY